MVSNAVQASFQQTYGIFCNAVTLLDNVTYSICNLWWIWNTSDWLENPNPLWSLTYNFGVCFPARSFACCIYLGLEHDLCSVLLAVPHTTVEGAFSRFSREPAFSKSRTESPWGNSCGPSLVEALPSLPVEGRHGGCAKSQGAERGALFTARSPGSTALAC